MKWLFPLGIIGSVVAALFCGTVLTPLLVAFLAAIGLSFLDPDLVVVPVLVGFLILTYVGWRTWRRARPGLDT